jgi:hypothetical protein
MSMKRRNAAVTVIFIIVVLDLLALGWWTVRLVQLDRAKPS